MKMRSLPPIALDTADEPLAGRIIETEPVSTPLVAFLTYSLT